MSSIASENLNSVLNGIGKSENCVLNRVRVLTPGLHLPTRASIEYPPVLERERYVWLMHVVFPVQITWHCREFSSRSSAIPSCNSYTSIMLSKLLCPSITRRMHAGHEAIVLWYWHSLRNSSFSKLLKVYWHAFQWLHCLISVWP